MNIPAYFIRPDTGRRVRVRNFGMTVKVPSSSTNDSVSVIEMTLEPGYVAMPMHVHRNEVEVSVVLEGTLTVQIGEQVIAAPVRSYVVKPAGIRHTYWNSGPEPVRFVEIISPGKLDGFYEALDDLVPDDGMPDIGGILELAERYGLEFDMAGLEELKKRRGVELS